MSEQKEYAVEIKVEIRKTITVTAENKSEADELANQKFNVNNDGGNESYSQDTLSVKEVISEEDEVKGLVVILYNEFLETYYTRIKELAGDAIHQREIDKPGS